MTDEPKSRVDLERLRAFVEEARDEISADDKRRTITIRAVAKVLEDVHLEGRVRGEHFESDEPAARGGSGLAPAPLDYFVIGAAF